MLQRVLKNVLLQTCRFSFTPIYVYHKCWLKLYLRHKNITMFPQLLLAHTPPIPFHTLKQSKGEYVITFPSAFHFVCNSGYNCAEAINFVTPEWKYFDVETSKYLEKCTCSLKEQLEYLNTFFKNWILAFVFDLCGTYWKYTVFNHSLLC
jgi:hypothetical protein